MKITSQTDRERLASNVYGIPLRVMQNHPDKTRLVDEAIRVDGFLRELGFEVHRLSETERELVRQLDSTRAKRGAIQSVISERYENVRHQIGDVNT